MPDFDFWGNTALNVYSAVCAAIVLFTPLIAKGVMLNRQPRSLFQKSFYKRIHPGLILMVFASLGAVIFQIKKDNLSTSKIQTKDNYSGDLIKAIAEQGFRYDAFTKELKKLNAQNNTKQSSPAQFSHELLRPFFDLHGYLPTFTDNTYSISTRIHFNFFNMGNDPASNLAVKGVFINLNSTPKNPGSFAETRLQTVVDRQSGTGIDVPYPTELGKIKLTDSDTIYSIIKLSYTNSGGKRMPAQFFYFEHTPSFGTQWMGSNLETVARLKSRQTKIGFN